jgi:predicted nucleic acid-binding protein
VIYIDASVAIAHLMAESRSPPAALWVEPLVSSKLLEYEIWNRIYAYRLGQSHADEARAVLGRVGLIELSDEVLARALQPFPLAIRTLDGLHLATLEYIDRREGAVELASYDQRLVSAARALGISLVTL